MLPPVRGRVMAELSEINPGNRAIAYDDATADDQVPQVGIARASDWPDERIVQTEIARMRQVEDRKIGKLARGNHAAILEAEHAGTISARPAHDVFDRHRAGALGGTVGMPGAMHFTDHVGGLVRGRAIDRERNRAA
jgi:hypothetical protein